MTDTHDVTMAVRYTAKTEVQEGLPTAKVGNLVVGNWSSPHSFTFEDGTVLEACSPERSKECSVPREDVETPSECGRYVVVKPVFRLSDENVNDLLVSAASVDVLVVPFPVLEAIRAAGERVAGLVHDRAATCILVDRQTKVCSVTKFGR